MGLEEVKKEILQKAESEADKLVSEGRKEAERISKETDQQISDYKKQVGEETEKLMEGMERKEKAGAEFDVKKMKLDKKKEIMDRAFDNAKKTLASLPEKKRAEHIKKLVDRAKKEIDVAYVYANSNDKSIVEKMKGIEYRKADIAGGIIAENRDSSIRVDYSFEEIMGNIEKESIQKIAEILFRE